MEKWGKHHLSRTLLRAMGMMLYLQIREARLPGKGVGGGWKGKPVSALTVFTWLHPGTYPVTPGQAVAPPLWIEEAGKGGEERRPAGLPGSGSQCRAGWAVSGA